MNTISQRTALATGAAAITTGAISAPGAHAALAGEPLVVLEAELIEARAVQYKAWEAWRSAGLCTATNDLGRLETIGARRPGRARSASVLHSPPGVGRSLVRGRCHDESAKVALQPVLFGRSGGVAVSV